MKPTKETIYIAIGYVLFLLLFFFIGIPGGKSFWTYAGGFLVVTAFYAFGVWFVKKIIAHQK